MTENLKMFGRYALAIGVSYALGKGWINQAQGDQITSIMIELAALAVSFSPAIYAALKIDNAPKT